MAQQQNSRPSGTPATASTHNDDKKDSSLLVSRYILEAVETSSRSSRTSSAGSCHRNKGFHVGNRFVGITYGDSVDGVGIRRGDKLVGVTTSGSDTKKRSKDQQKEKIDTAGYEELDSSLPKPSEVGLTHVRWV